VGLVPDGGRGGASRLTGVGPTAEGGRRGSWRGGATFFSRSNEAGGGAIEVLGATVKKA
jgi:hypothetical protein